MKSFQLAETKLQALIPTGDVFVMVRNIRLQAKLQSQQLFLYLSTGGKFRINFDLNKDLTFCNIDLVRDKIRMQNMSIRRDGNDILIKLKGY